tara:strand:+ start:442 stop:618 length:177 start_codon:yes stop_codon:yes gene_type:complete
MDKRKTIALACLVFIGGFLAGQTSKVNQINNKLSELNMDWYQWQDVEKIVNNESINGY